MRKIIIIAALLAVHGFASAAVMADANEYDAVFKEDMGRYVYAYPSTSTIEVAEEGAKDGRACLALTLDHQDYSGGAFAFSAPIDLSSIRDEGALSFWIKGGKGGERLEIALVNEQEDGKKAESVLSLNSIASVDNQWKKVTIPIKLFPKKGICWDAMNGKEIPVDFDWKNVTEFKVRTRPVQGNGDVKLFFDDIVFLKSSSSKVDSLVVFDGIFPSYTYAYPASSEISVASGQAFEGKASAKLALDPGDYSGAALAFGPLDLSGMRQDGVLEFMMKGSSGGEKVELDLVQAVEPKVETGVNLGGIKPVTTEWQKYEIPLNMFPDKGRYWDDSVKKEISAGMTNWDKIGELKFKIRKDDNKNCVLYITDIKFRIR
ncbi:MAG: carbohydrate binding domain-containing protein [Candidatus Omnitrophota bacterium]